MKAAAKRTKPSPKVNLRQGALKEEWRIYRHQKFIHGAMYAVSFEDECEVKITAACTISGALGFREFVHTFAAGADAAAEIARALEALRARAGQWVKEARAVRVKARR